MGDQRETIEYDGRVRQITGRLHYSDPPDPGSIVGPNAWGETCVVLGNRVEDGRLTTLIGLAITTDAEAAIHRIDEPQTLAEFRTRLMTQNVPEIFRGPSYGGTK